VKHDDSDNQPDNLAAVDIPIPLLCATHFTSKRPQLKFLVSEIGRWNKTLNLVADPTPDVVSRSHIADSTQLLRIAPTATQWLDIGTGAGFPGMVIAILLSSLPGARVHCVESDHRKCAYLRHVAGETNAPAVICCDQIEALPRESLRSIDVVTARAFSTLPRLIRLSEFWIEGGATGLFPRAAEETSQSKYWKYKNTLNFTLYQAQQIPVTQ